MANSKIRYLIPAVLAVVGIWYATRTILSITTMVSLPSAFAFLDLSTTDLMSFIMLIAVPALIIEYALIAVPGAALILIGARILRSPSYEVNIMNIGTDFGGVRMARRAVTPALFSLSSSAQLKGLIEATLFGPNPPVPTGYELTYDITLALMASLLFLPIALAFFMPTWVLNDAGIVSHLHDDKLNVRQCPDTQGVGRWVGNILGGYAIIAFPIAMFTNHFWNPFVVEGRILSLESAMISSLWIIVLPFLVMAFILPVIAVNELNQNRIRKQVSSVATRMGATVVLKPQIEKIDSHEAFKSRKRLIKKEGILETEEVAEIITSSKGIPIKKTKSKGKNDKSKKDKKSNKK